jgi:hypothetical protein
MIKTWRNDWAVGAGDVWAACLGDYDLGAYVATGATEAEAVQELIDMLDLDGADDSPLPVTWSKATGERLT